MLCYNGLLHCLNLFMFSWDLVKNLCLCVAFSEYQERGCACLQRAISLHAALLAHHACPLYLPTTYCWAIALHCLTLPNTITTLPTALPTLLHCRAISPETLSAAAINFLSHSREVNIYTQPLHTLSSTFIWQNGNTANEDKLNTTFWGARTTLRYGGGMPRY